MGLEKHISTPAAILIGSVVLAAGLFFGLRQGPEAPAPPASSAAPQPPQLQPPPPTRSPPPAAPEPRASRDDVAREAAKALEVHRAAIVERCWKPSVAKSAAPPSIKYVFNFTFDAEGRQLSRGVSEDRAAARPDVTACMLPMLPPLSIPPPGANTYVEIPFSLP